MQWPLASHRRYFIGLFFREDLGDRAPMTYAVCEKEGSAPRSGSKYLASIHQSRMMLVDAGVRVSMPKLLSSIGKNPSHIHILVSNMRSTYRFSTQSLSCSRMWTLEFRTILVVKISRNYLQFAISFRTIPFVSAGHAGKRGII